MASGKMPPMTSPISSSPLLFLLWLAILFFGQRLPKMFFLPRG
jgi:hypothetical protein